MKHRVESLNTKYFPFKGKLKDRLCVSSSKYYRWETGCAKKQRWRMKMAEQTTSRKKADSDRCKPAYQVRYEQIT